MNGARIIDTTATPGPHYPPPPTYTHLKSYKLLRPRTQYLSSHLKAIFLDILMDWTCGFSFLNAASVLACTSLRLSIIYRRLSMTTVQAARGPNKSTSSFLNAASGRLVLTIMTPPDTRHWLETSFTAHSFLLSCVQSLLVLGPCSGYHGAAPWHSKTVQTAVHCNRSDSCSYLQ